MVIPPDKVSIANLEDAIAMAMFRALGESWRIRKGIYMLPAVSIMLPHYTVKLVEETRLIEEDGAISAGHADEYILYLKPYVVEMGTHRPDYTFYAGAARDGMVYARPYVGTAPVRWTFI
jgi:hypothetical protein